MHYDLTAGRVVLVLPSLLFLFINQRPIVTLINITLGIFSRARLSLCRMIIIMSFGHS